jgi:C_GCAxxG_C_C family probable redox protein
MNVTKQEEAASLFNDGFNCAQSVLAAFSQDHGLDREKALRLAGSFGGGMARMGETCGAVTGALMVLGLRHGMTQKEAPQTKENNYSEVLKFVDEFKARYGSIRCRDLLGCEISTMAGRQKASDQKLFSTLCPKLVGGVVEILEKNL